MQKLNPNDIIPLNEFEGDFPIITDMVYSKPAHPDNHFPNLYHPEASLLWAHKDLVVITLVAAEICHSLYGWKLKLNDSLRPIEAQEAMADYGHHPSLVFLPGSGAHPRAFAIDIEPIDKDGKPVNMGTRFDHFVNDPVNEDNPAARNFTKFSSLAEANLVSENRRKLTFAMNFAATQSGLKILPLPQEWWDYRLPDDVTEKFEPLREADLLPCQRLIDIDADALNEAKKGIYSVEMQERIDEVIQRASDTMKSFGLSRNQPVANDSLLARHSNLNFK